MRHSWMLVGVAAMVAATSAVGAGTANAAFPGANGKIGFVEDVASPSGPRTEIRTMNPDGSEVRTILAGAWQPSWSPDGRTIAYTDYPGGTPQVFTMNADGSGVRQITSFPFGAEGPAWSADGARLAMARYASAEMFNTGIWTVRASDGGDPRQVVPATDGSGRPLYAWAPAWSVDGRIAYSAATYTSGAAADAIFAVDADGTGVVRITSGDGAFEPDWSPDGRWIVFERRHGMLPTTLHVIGADGDGERVLVQNGAWSHGAVWSPDGSQVAFGTTITDGSGDGGLYLVDADGSDIRLLRDGGSAPSWQPIPGPTADPASVTRSSGTDRVETAIAISKASFPQARSATAVVLARADAFPDALAGTPLAVAEDGPLLLTSGQTLDPRVKAEIGRVLQPGGTIFLLGGPAALSASVADETAALSTSVRRLAGSDRFATAVRIAEAMDGTTGPVFLATGANFPDALGAGAAAAHTDGVVLLTADTVLPRATADRLRSSPSTLTYAVGGQAAKAAPTATPLVGTDRFATARLLAEAVFDDPSIVGVASGINFPDGLAGGAHAGRSGAPLLLVLPDALPAETARYLDGPARVGSAHVYGGEAAVSYQVTNAIGVLLTAG